MPERCGLCGRVDDTMFSAVFGDYVCQWCYRDLDSDN